MFDREKLREVANEYRTASTEEERRTVLTAAGIGTPQRAPLGRFLRELPGLIRKERGPWTVCRPDGPKLRFPADMPVFDKKSQARQEADKRSSGDEVWWVTQVPPGKPHTSFLS